MKPMDVKEVNFDLVALDGHMALFSNLRIDRDTLPEGLHGYDVRDSDHLDGSAAEVKPFVMVNHWGTLLCREPIPLDEHSSYYPQDDIDYICGMTLEDFMAATPEKLQAMADEVMPIHPQMTPSL